MQYHTISEIYDQNDRIRASLREALSGLTDQRAAARPGDEKWSIAEIAEHLSIVGHGMYRICSKLLSKAQAVGDLAHGTIDLSSFAVKAAEIAGVKLEAPEMVRPTGTRSIAESVAALNEVRDRFQGLKPLFEKYDGGGATFPHPYLGDLTAIEWLALYGEHEKRHLRQIEEIIRKAVNTGQSRER